MIRFGTQLLQALGIASEATHGVAPADRMRRMYERAELLDELGFDFGTIGHHRFTERYVSAPFELLAAAAARTSRLRLGTGVLILPSLHPLDVAERVATIDQISNGRAFIGVGVGYRNYEFDPLQIPFETRGARMDECLQILERVWTEENVTFEGEHFQFEDVTVHPRPVQDRIPIWVGAQLRRAVVRAGRLGDLWYSGTMEPLSKVVPIVDLYRSTAAEAQRQSAVCLKRPFAIASTREEVEETWLPGYLNFYRHYVNAGGRWDDEPTFKERVVSGDRITLDDMGDRAIAGTPDDCIRAIKRFHEATGCEYVHLQLDGQADNPQGIPEQLRLFAEEVMPAFAA